LADEPTSALDAVHQASFVSLLLELAQASKVTVIMVSHDDRMGSSFDEVWSLYESGGLEALR
jgi:putative ABC transport system ATP-binding protein